MYCQVRISGAGRTKGTLLLQFFKAVAAMTKWVRWNKEFPTLEAEEFSFASLFAITAKRGED
jgi:hypothetical protein